ncbi:MAG TPA: NAD-dependent epimerase/dehydratase family protein [Gaiellales bacterium]|nr:NAD-dependent epimerase/dehydratase family protein [Gaiellales bacterium]
MRILVTGATGYIGAVVSETLSARGHTVVGTARSPAAEAELAARGYEIARADLLEPESLARAAAACDAVVHTAATQDEDMGPAEQAAVRAMLAGLAGSGKAFVYTSGVWVYGSAPPGRVMDEDTPPDPVALFAWRPALEAEVIAAAARGVRTIVIRPGMVYGRGGGPCNQFAAMAEDGVPRYVGDGQNHWSLVHVDDLAELYALAIERAPAGTLVNGVAGPPLRVRDLAEAAAAGAGFEAAPVAWPVTEAAVELGAEDADGVTRDHRISGERARALLGWAPAPRSPLDELRSQRTDGCSQSPRDSP